MTNIKLSWMNKIREQMNVTKKHPNLEIEKFIRPIIEYGLKEEKRISKKFMENVK